MSVIQPEFVCVCRQLIQRSDLLFAHLTGVGDEILERDPAVRSDHSMLKPAGLNFLDHEWARHSGVYELGVDRCRSQLATARRSGRSFGCRDGSRVDSEGERGYSIVKYHL